MMKDDKFVKGYLSGISCYVYAYILCTDNEEAVKENVSQSGEEGIGGIGQLSC